MFLNVPDDRIVAHRTSPSASSEVQVVANKIDVRSASTHGCLTKTGCGFDPTFEWSNPLSPSHTFGVAS
jgi:hypothetical protein